MPSTQNTLKSYGTTTAGNIRQLSPLPPYCALLPALGAIVVLARMAVAAAGSLLAGSQL